MATKNSPIDKVLDAKAEQRLQSTLQPFVFPVSGRKIMIRKVSPYLLTDIAQSMSPPEPPVLELNYGTPEKPKYKKEYNYADPEFIKAKAAHDVESESKLRRILFRKGIEHKLTEAEQAEVDEEKEFYEEEEIAGLEGQTDLMIFLSNICIQGSEDMEAIQSALVGASFSARAEDSGAN